MHEGYPYGHYKDMLDKLYLVIALKEMDWGEKKIETKKISLLYF